MTFRLTTLFYVTALLASALAAFGVGGLLALPLVGAVPVGRWYCRNLRYAEGAMILLWFVIGLLAIGLAGLIYLVGESVWRPVDKYYSEARRSDDRLLDISKTLVWWHPPNTSQPHSWRVHLLTRSPNFGSFLANNYRFEEPWDSEQNRKSSLFDLYQRFSHSGGYRTHYLTIVDPQCAWREEGRLVAGQISDGAENTLLLMETTSFDIAWNEPRDLTFDEALTLLTTEPSPKSRDWHVAPGKAFYRDRKYRKVLTCDGEVIDLKIPIDREHAIALLTASGGEEIDWAEIEVHGSQQLDYARVAAFAVFVLLALSPLHPRIWKMVGFAAWRGDLTRRRRDTETEQQVAASPTGE